MTEVTLEQALNQISPTSGLKARGDGLQDLKHILLLSKDSDKPKRLGDKAYHSIFEALFRLLAAEKVTYYRAKSIGTKNSAIARIESCASTLRTTAEVGRRRIKQKTLLAVVDHVTEVLSEPEQELWGPLSSDYLKTLRILLGYPAHVEHLSKDVWKNLCGFCLDILGTLGSETETQASSGRSPRTTGSWGDSIGRASSVDPSSLRRRQQQSEQQGAREELEACLDLLCSSPAAPIAEEGPKILCSLLEYILSLQTISSSAHAVMRAFNVVVFQTLKGNVASAQMALLNILPFIRHFWIPRSVALKEEMIITLDIISYIFPHIKDTEFLRLAEESLPGLVDQLQREYLKSGQRDILHIDDVVFTPPCVTAPMGINSMAPRLGLARAEANWTLLRAIATLTKLIDKLRPPAGFPDESAIGLETPTKKRFRISRTDSLFRDAHSSVGPERIFALHLFPFLLEASEKPPHELASLLAKLNNGILGDQDDLQSWTIIAIASIACLPQASAGELKPVWAQTWNLVLRTLSSPRSSRAACHLVTMVVHFRLLDDSSIFATINSMLSSVDLNGPSGLTDSSLHMWSCLMERTTTSYPARSQYISKQICQWLANEWVYDTMTDRARNTSLATYARPQEVIDLLLMCTGRRATIRPTHYFGTVSRISRAWICQQMDSELIDYLLLCESTSKHQLPFPDAQAYRELSESQPNDQIVIDFLKAKAEQFSLLWGALATENARRITTDAIHVLTSLCIVSTFFLELPRSSSGNHEDLARETKKLWSSICSYVRDQDVKFLEPCLQILAPLLLPLKLSPQEMSLSQSLVLRSLLRLGEPLGFVLDKVLDNASSELSAMPTNGATAIDLMGSDTAHTAHDSSGYEREDVPSLMFPDGQLMIRATIIHYSMLMQVHGQSQYSSDAIEVRFVDFIKRLSAPDILAWRPALLNLLGTDLHVPRKDAVNLLEHLADSILPSYSVQKCEAALSTLVLIVTAVIHMRNPERDDEFELTTSDLVDWFSDAMIDGNKGTPKVMTRVANLYQRILLSPANLHDETKNAFRTKILKLIDATDLTSKYHIAKLLPTFIQQSPTSGDDEFFDSICDKFPYLLEGAAIRFFLLDQLACNCRPILRRSIYRVFETAGRFPESSAYARRCLNDISTSLGLTGPRDIFHLFASQLLYTWLEPREEEFKDLLASIPFTIFDYPSLKDMLLDVQDEIIAQVMLHGQMDELPELCEVLECPQEGLLSRSFPRCEAYIVAHSISVPPSQDRPQAGSEKDLKTLLGKDRFNSLLVLSFPNIISTLFQSIDEPGVASLNRFPNRRALSTWKAIDEKCYLAEAVPVGHQPCFRAKYLFDELDYVCKRTQIILDQMWTPALFCHVARSLMDTVQPALGSSQAAAVLRKLKLLICIAGPVALEGYGPPMLLQFLRPYLTDSQCYKDALGMSWYIYENRHDNSLLEASFEVGLALSSIVAARAFLIGLRETEPGTSALASPDFSELHSFLSWFSSPSQCSRFAGLIFPQDGDQSLFLQNLIGYARDFEISGTSDANTSAGKLLLGLLTNQSVEKPMIDGPARDILFSVLCSNFQSTSNPETDIMSSDSAAITLAYRAWQSCPTQKAKRSYKLWVSRALGRAYSASGLSEHPLLQEKIAIPYEGTDVDKDNTSKFAIVKVLYDTLTSQNPKEVGHAERTLQAIVNGLGVSKASAGCEKALPRNVLHSFNWTPYTCPSVALRLSELEQFPRRVRWNPSLTVSVWAQEMSISLCRDKLTHFVIGSLPRVLYTYPAIAQELVPYIIHDALLSEFHKTQQTRLDISNVFNQAFRSSSKDTIPHLKLIINCILYLRFQQLPNESNVDDRDFWLDIDYMSAAMAASLCQMPKTALLFVEIHHSHLATGSRRNSAVSTNPLNSQLLHDVFQAIGDPDLPYGLEQDSSLEAMLHSLSHDGNPLQKLTLLSASHDADVRLRQGSSSDGSLEFVKALNETNLQGLAQNMLSNPGAAQGDGQDQGILLSTALYLQQWDIPIPSSGTSPMGEVFNIFKSLNTLGDKRQICHLIDDSFLGVFNELAIRQTPNSFQKHLQALGILGEIDGIVSSGSQNLLSQWERIMSRNEWLKYESLDNIKHMLYCREALFSSLSREGPLQSCVNGDGRLTRQLEFKTIQESLRVYKEHDDLQAAMKSAVSLTKLIPSCRKQGLLVDAAAQFEFAQVLWHQGEMSRSIQLLQQLRTKDLRPQSIEVDQARLLATLGHHIFEAREGGAETVRVDYLTPAGRILDHSKEARQKDAGVVYHEFAVFCDRYVSHPDGIAEFKRVQQTWSRRNQEIIELEYEAENATGAQKQRNAVLLKKANQWFELDDAEYERQKESREHFVVNAIENYLKSLSDCDIYKDDVLRFCALWLDNYSNVAVCAAVEKHLNSVPSYRFAPLVSQLCSRLLDVDDTFQSHLSALMQRICVDHPYHGMYQVFMSSKSRIGEDAASKSRCRAANKVADAIKTKRELWVRLHNANVMYHRFATEPLNEKARAGTKAYLKKTEAGQFLERDIPSSKLPPPTMRIELRRNCDYSDVPVVTSYLPQYSIASGVSAPKIATAIASDGLRYKQLFKGGNDDLRQDQIMEQVFEQVSGLLREHRDTRQRQLAIRTYKVVPITANTGVIEFVQNTIPLNDYLLPAHVSHFPRDMSYRNARELITKVQSKSLRERVKTYMHVTNNFHPVLRFFFMERFLNPDDWFKKRLAYTRSTAAISILGHILGLGDRHGHNILLDERTGEVVHIDLGVAFEQGRVLPIPEVVPFRLTRDLVDGMGITKTKGVFARCCEFTLDALRQESYSIMTILDVLRYDPLYSWSLSPVRAKKMQDEEKRGKLVGSDANDNANEPSEADRALTVVAKKLEKSLSVSTTVNELIRQATDVNNLAVLYSGWAAFA